MTTPSAAELATRRIRANASLIEKCEARAIGGHPDQVRQSPEWQEVADALILNSATLQDIASHLSTEAEAKTKWCPFARVAFDNVNGVPVWTSPSPDAVKCVGSACMAWRWTSPQFANPTDDERARETGFCGLAGKP